jgi:hypothetical protein
MTATGRSSSSLEGSPEEDEEEGGGRGTASIEGEEKDCPIRETREMYTSFSGYFIYFRDCLQFEFERAKTTSVPMSTTPPQGEEELKDGTSDVPPARRIETEATGPTSRCEPTPEELKGTQTIVRAKPEEEELWFNIWSSVFYLVPAGVALHRGSKLYGSYYTTVAFLSTMAHRSAFSWPWGQLDVFFARCGLFMHLLQCHKSKRLRWLHYSMTVLGLCASCPCQPANLFAAVVLFVYKKGTKYYKEGKLLEYNIWHAIWHMASAACMTAALAG